MDRRQDMALAYDYDKQEWVKGNTATAVLAKQAQETLAVIDEPAYQHMVGLTPAEAAAIKTRLLRG